MEKDFSHIYQLWKVFRRIINQTAAHAQNGGKCPLSKPPRRRQQERHQTKGLMSKTIAEHLCHNFLYISLPSSAKQQREMTKFWGAYETKTTPANFHFELNAVVTYVAVARF